MKIQENLNAGRSELLKRERRGSTRFEKKLVDFLQCADIVML